MVLLILYLRNTFSGLKVHLHIHKINAVGYYLWYGVVYKRQYTDKTLTLRKSMYMRSNGASELRKCSHIYILKLLFLSIFCWYFRYFVGTNDMLVGLHVATNRPNGTGKTLKKHYWGGGIAPLPPELR